MNKAALYSFTVILCLLLGALGYFITSSLFFFIGIFFFYVLMAFFVLHPMYVRYRIKERKRHECYRFVTSFIISYSATKSLEKSYLSSLEGSGPEFKEIQESIISQTIRERLFYLNGYFESDLYEMFLSLFTLFEEQGGDLLTIAKGLLDELTRVEESGDTIRKESLRNLREYVLLWGMSLTILAFLRFGLSNFYSILLTSPVYLSTIGVYFVFLLFSILIYLSAFFNQKIAIKRRKNEKTS